MRWLTGGEFRPPGTCSLDFALSEAAIAATAAGAAEAGAGAGLAGFGAGGLAGTAAGFSLPSLSTVAPFVGLGGTILQAGSQFRAADSAAAAQRAEAAALELKAGQDAAAAQRVAISRDRQARLALSRSQALAADSGAGATDPTVVTGEENLAQQGEYNVQSALYEGQAAARADRLQADIDLFNARQRLRAAPIAAAGTILSGISAFAGARQRAQMLLSNRYDFGP